MVIDTSFHFFGILTSVLTLSLIILWYLFRPPFPMFCPLYHMCSRGRNFTSSSLHELGMVNAFGAHSPISSQCASRGVQFLNNCSLHVPLKCRCPIKKSDHTVHVPYTILRKTWDLCSPHKWLSPIRNQNSQISKKLVTGNSTKFTILAVVGY